MEPPTSEAIGFFYVVRNLFYTQYVAGISLHE